MILEDLYKQKRTLFDYRRGPLGQHFDGLIGHLENLGYARSSIKDVIGRLCQFNYFLMDRGQREVDNLTMSFTEPFVDVYISAFRDHHAYAATKAKSLRCDLKHLFNYLAKVKIIELPVPEPVAAKPCDWILGPFLDYLRREGSLRDNTIQNKRRLLEPALAAFVITDDRTSIKDLKAEVVEEYVKKHFKDSVSNFRTIASALRGFFQFCAREGHTSIDLSGLLPHAPGYRMATLPKGMDDSAIEAIFAGIPKDTPAGMRDRAIMLLLMAFGMRGTQVAKLSLDDINWQRSLVRIRAEKGGREVVLPMLDSVGEAILAYLQHRPKSLNREVFLVTKAPHRPVTSVGIGAMIRGYAKAAGLDLPRCGTHTMRHSWAIRALAHGAPMKAIADVFGHKHLDTTFIYAKTDTKALREVALPWPEVSR